jgi:hypothetical protein
MYYKLKIMINTYRYNTVTEAIKTLREDGFTADFDLKRGTIFSNGKRLTARQVRLVVVYRYEGLSDPADEATVYGLLTSEGIKGILVTGDEIYSETESAAFLALLHQSERKMATQ